MTICRVPCPLSVSSNASMLRSRMRRSNRSIPSTPLKGTPCAIPRTGDAVSRTSCRAVTKSALAERCDKISVSTCPLACRPAKSYTRRVVMFSKVVSAWLTLPSASLASRRHEEGMGARYATRPLPDAWQASFESKKKVSIPARRMIPGIGVSREFLCRCGLPRARESACPGKPGGRATDKVSPCRAGVRPTAFKEGWRK
jgi:hypothetical protein